LGAVFGILTCFLLFSYLGYKKLFFLASIPSLISAVLVLAFIKERKTKRIYKGLSLKDLTPNFKLFLLLSALFALGSFSYSFLLVYAKEFGFEETHTIILYLEFTAIASLMSLPFGKLADKLKRKTVLILSYFLFGLMCFGFIFVKSYWGIIVLFAVYGLHKAAIDPVQRTLVSELSPLKYRASTLGAFQMVTGLCALPASLLAGLLWVNFGKSVPFYFSSSLTVLATILMLFIEEP